jgi:hypothetical protein
MPDVRTTLTDTGRLRLPVNHLRRKRMRRPSTAIPLTVLIALTGLGVAAAEDMTIISQVTPAKGKPTTSTQYITKDKIRMGDGQLDTIVDLASGRMVQIDHKKKKYFETTFEEMRQHFAQLEQMMGSNPMMESMMGKVGEIKIQHTPETREILGYSCTKYVMTMGDNFSQTMWVTPELTIPLEYYDASKMIYAMMGPMAARFEKMLDGMKEIEGFPLANDVDMKVMGMDASSDSVVTELRKGPISPDTFAVPAGYKKKKSPFDE